MPAIASFLVAFAVARTLLNPASYLLARQGAAAQSAGPAITLGATNLLLGVGGLSGLLLASLGLTHPRPTQAAIALLCLASATAIARTARRRTTAGAPPPDPPAGPRPNKTKRQRDSDHARADKNQRPTSLLRSRLVGSAGGFLGRTARAGPTVRGCLPPPHRIG